MYLPMIGSSAFTVSAGISERSVISENLSASSQMQPRECGSPIRYSISRTTPCDILTFWPMTSITETPETASSSSCQQS
jgi:hypothetical protein